MLDYFNSILNVFQMQLQFCQQCVGFYYKFKHRIFVIMEAYFKAFLYINYPCSQELTAEFQ